MTRRTLPASGAGREIRDARIRLGMSQAVLARKARLSQGYVSRFERGEAELGPATIERMRRALGIKP